jgi:uncharacterized protein (TIGR02246 family)
VNDNILQSKDKDEIAFLYHKLLERWNERNSNDMAELFKEDGNLIGFDGSQVNGQSDIKLHLSQIFDNHPTAKFIGKIQSIKFLDLDVAVIFAVAGMVQPGQTDINPSLNAIQTLITAKHNGLWRIVVFQNTPAAFHGRPELREQLTAEIREILHQHEQQTN